MANLFAGTNPEISEREKRNMERSRRIAGQGMVLLKNNGILPLRENVKRIALFGRGARNTVKGGTGSGDVNSRFSVNIEQGLKEGGYTLVADACSDPADAVIYVISRNSGEAKDRKPEPGDYYLSPEEESDLRTLTGAFPDVIVVLNTGGVIDTKVIRSMESIGAIVLMSQAGCLGGNALCDVLSGKTDPCGRLTDTWAENYEDYPSASSFSHLSKNLDDAYYSEGIFVGYRYFDTFNITPAYPFGYGNSYAEFTWETVKAELVQLQVTLTVKVTNISRLYAGRETIQVYYSSPQGELEKPYQELAAFAKTRLLKPGEAQELVISYPVAQMASYSEKEAAYLLEPGTYYIRAGIHSRKTEIAAAVKISQKIQTRKLKNLLSTDREWTERTANGIFSYQAPGEEEQKAAAVVLTVPAGQIPCKTVSYRTTPKRCSAPDLSHKITLEEVKAGIYPMEDLVGQLTVEEMAVLCVGTARGNKKKFSDIGNASSLCPGAAGDTTSLMLEDRKIQNVVLADGPAGLRLAPTFTAENPARPFPQNLEMHYQYCTALPIATLLAQTWDMELLREAGEIVGEEMTEFGVTLWLAPGMNIHRNPLCGRNFEYYSEDPLLSGLCAAASTLGVQKYPGCGACIKHFAMNNQEDNRKHVNVHVSERAAREIYLKGFEIAVENAHPMSMMSSYNLINGIHSANHYDLLTALARDEWGFDGIVMTDWRTTKGSEPAHHAKYDSSSAAGCIRAGNDLIMPGSQADVDEIIQAVGAEDGEAECPLTLEELQACASRILHMIARSRDVSPKSDNQLFSIS